MSALIYAIAAPRIVRLIAVTILLSVCWIAIARPWRSALLLDAALALLTIYRPWPILLALAVVQIAYRWSPPLATFIGELLDERFDGLTIALVRWWLPGWAPTTERRGKQLLDRAPALVQRTGATLGETIALASPQPVAQERAPMPIGRWLHLLNDQPDDAPHTFIAGGSGTGKTTFARAVLAGRSGPVAIIGVKQDDAWAGAATYLSSARGPALAALRLEITRRQDANDRSGLTIVFDDYTRLAELEPDAGALFREVADIGRTLRLRLIVLARGRLVAGTKTSGESDLREHFVFINLSRSHGATMEYDGDTIPLDTTGLDREVAALPPLDAGRVWRPPLAVCVDTKGADSTLQTHTHTQTHGANASDGRFTPEAEARIATYVQWRSAGLTRDQARAIRQGTGEGLDDREWAEAGKRLAMTAQKVETA